MTCLVFWRFEDINATLLDLSYAVVVTTWVYFDSGNFHTDSWILCRDLMFL